jgi:uncharacterized membrane protein
MWTYRARVEKDLDRWRTAGWVSDAGAQSIRAELAKRSRGPGLSTALAILGAVLIGFAAMSFVAANWQEMPKLARLLMLLAGVWGSYGLAGVLFERGLSNLAHAAVLAGVAIFGASIMLISQMYHIDGHPPDGVLTWAAGAFLAGLALQSRPALAATLLLLGLWSGWETALSGKTHWWFLPAWAAVTAALVWLRWRPGLHLAALLLSAWVVFLGFLLAKGHAHWLVALIGLAVVAGALFGEHVLPQVKPFAPAALGYGMIIAFAGLFGLQFFEMRGAGALTLLALLTLVGMVAAVAWGWRTDQRNILWLGYAGFSLEILALYFKTIGTLLGTSLFFLLAGVIVSALAAVAYRLHANEPSARGSAT